MIKLRIDIILRILTSVNINYIWFFPYYQNILIFQTLEKVLLDINQPAFII
jgi:hypothetical protein